MGQNRVDEERRTVEMMIRLYCKAHHKQELCNDCQQLLQYAFKRIEHCPHGQNKPTCDSCPIHCYAPAKREAIRRVMRYAGPRMIWHHPWLAIKHLIKRKCYFSTHGTV